MPHEEENMKKILVVDDDPDVREFCKTVLEAAGYTVCCVSEAKAAQEAAKKEQPDLAILDVMMEEIDSGFKLAELLAKSNPKLPMLLFTSIADISAQNFDTTSLPVAELIQKPVKPKELADKVGKLLAKAK
jgi:two-component system alkaline phosphatase synthesis response regulator PhoP